MMVVSEADIAAIEIAAVVKEMRSLVCGYGGATRIDNRTLTDWADRLLPPKKPLWLRFKAPEWRPVGLSDGAYHYWRRVGDGNPALSAIEIEPRVSVVAFVAAKECELTTWIRANVEGA